MFNHVTVFLWCNACQRWVEKDRNRGSICEYCGGAMDLMHDYNVMCWDCLDSNHPPPCDECANRFGCFAVETAAERQWFVDEMVDEVRERYEQFLNGTK